MFRLSGNAKILKYLAIQAAFALSAAGCGQISLGPAQPPNEQPPSGGTILWTASLNGLNGKTCSGSVTIYSLGSGQFDVYFNGISVPNENGLVVTANVNGAPLSQTAALRFFNGSQNYFFTIQNPSNPVWNNVLIHSNPANRDYCSANSP